VEHVRPQALELLIFVIATLATLEPIVNHLIRAIVIHAQMAQHVNLMEIFILVYAYKDTQALVVKLLIRALTIHVKMVLHV
jgi:hypothetical protein